MKFSKVIRFSCQYPLINYHDKEEETAEEDKNPEETDNKEDGSTGYEVFGQYTYFLRG